MRADPMERVSHGAALVAVVAASLLLAFAPRPPAPERVKPKEQEFVVALQAPPEPVHAEPPKPAPPPPPVKTPPPRPVPPRAAPAPVHATTAPTPIAAPKPEPVPLTPPVTPPKAVTPEPAPAPTPAPAPVNNVALESSFVGKLRTYIRSMTEYPTSGEARRLRPEGSVVVRFTLARSGAVRDVDVERGSNSPILDKQAVTIVKRGTYPAIPNDAWRGEEQHTFTVTLDFVAP
ncbi:MAG TPA: energy transducer TonB [Paraburkholderia sp.]|nr:energy transducer TonB [Paraburkholderia sp.]